MTRRFGFTLAEVLITLGIIGVVAAMTIPTVLSNATDAQFKTGYKKMMSVLNQAVTMNVALDNSDFTDISTVGTTAGSATLYNLFNSRMNVVRTATTTADISATNGNYTLFFNDGMALSFTSTNGVQATPKWTGAMNCSTTAPCSVIVDVNGVKKPNTLTTSTAAIKDQFALLLKDNQVVPGNEAAKQVLYQ